MALPIEDYALIGDCETAALVGRDGSIDWLCLPRFDSGACFAALLGEPKNGRFSIAPVGQARVTRRYRDHTLILETDFHTGVGDVRILDFMPLRAEAPRVVRIVRGLRGKVPMRAELVVRFDYGSTVPWVRRIDGGHTATAGPDLLAVRSPVELSGRDLTSVAEFAVAAGEDIPFVLAYGRSHLPVPAAIDAQRALAETEGVWTEWVKGALHASNGYHDAVTRSLVTLKALTYGPTGGIVAAATSSLPERIGGVRNWDYRFSWIRDATFTLYALLNAGYKEEAHAWHRWLLRTVAGKASQMQVLYGVAGERLIHEFEATWLAGYEGSKPVRFGNAASVQFQLDIYGEVLDALSLARRMGLPAGQSTWNLEEELLGFVEGHWREPDFGIWEIRGEGRHFTHSKVMAWVAADRAARSVADFGGPGDGARWARLRDAIHADVLRQGYSEKRGSFVQSYGSEELDASLLLMAPVGFLPPSDPRIVGTVEAIEADLLDGDGLVSRYHTHSDVDGLPPGEGKFLACSFWLADNLVLLGRKEEARAMFERLLALRNDVGLLSEQYDPVLKRQVGNFPQAFSHVALINTARNLTSGEGPAQHRASGDGRTSRASSPPEASRGSRRGRAR